MVLKRYNHSRKFGLLVEQFFNEVPWDESVIDIKFFDETSTSPNEVVILYEHWKEPIIQDDNMLEQLRQGLSWEQLMKKRKHYNYNKKYDISDANRRQRMEGDKLLMRRLKKEYGVGGYISRKPKVATVVKPTTSEDVKNMLKNEE